MYIHSTFTKQHTSVIVQGRWSSITSSSRGAQQRSLHSASTNNNTTPTDDAAASGADAAAPHNQDLQQQQQLGGVLRRTCKVAGKTWTFETGRLAGLAHGSCLVTVEGTSVLGTAVVDPTPQPDADGVPLQVRGLFVALCQQEQQRDGRC